MICEPRKLFTINNRANFIVHFKLTNFIFKQPDMIPCATMANWKMPTFLTKKVLPKHHLKQKKVHSALQKMYNSTKSKKMFKLT
jgi:hypothetical protein